MERATVLVKSEPVLDASFDRKATISLLALTTGFCTCCIIPSIN